MTSWLLRRRQGRGNDVLRSTTSTTLEFCSARRTGGCITPGAGFEQRNYDGDGPVVGCSFVGAKIS